jgi:hypothetical protein
MLVIRYELRQPANFHMLTSGRPWLDRQGEEGPPVRRRGYLLNSDIYDHPALYDALLPATPHTCSTTWILPARRPATFWSWPVRRAN